MGRLLNLGFGVASLALATGFVVSQSAKTTSAETAADRFQPMRGINLDIWAEKPVVADAAPKLDAAQPYAGWHRPVSADQLRALHRQGYDFARLPIDPAPLLQLGPGAAQDLEIANIAKAAVAVEETGLKVIVDLHSYHRHQDHWGVDDVLGDPQLFDAYTIVLGKVAAKLTGLDPDRTALELLNEPSIDCKAVKGGATALWPTEQKKLHATARAAAPDLPLVLTGACWGSAEALATLDPADVADDNILWSFHSYTPFIFTDQGTTETGRLDATIRHLPFPPDLLSAEAADSVAQNAVALALQRNFKTTPAATLPNLQSAMAAYRATPDGRVGDDATLVAKWADAHHIPHNRLIMGEFGANHAPGNDLAADRDSRLRFLGAKRRSAEALGIGWAVWAWAGTYGVVRDEVSRAPDADICAALGIGPCD